MRDVYQQMASRVGTAEALDLAAELTAWHDAMVKHRRTLVNTGGDPDHHEPDDDECPHTMAPFLWARARAVFGDEADTLVFLREAAAAQTAGNAPPPQAAGKTAARSAAKSTAR